MTLSENLTKLAHKIDWTNQGREDADDDEDGGLIEDGDETAKKTDFNVWPWDSVRNRLRVSEKI